MMAVDNLVQRLNGKVPQGAVNPEAVSVSKFPSQQLIIVVCENDKG